MAFDASMMGSMDLSSTSKFRKRKTVYKVDFFKPKSKKAIHKFIETKIKIPVKGKISTKTFSTKTKVKSFIRKQKKKGNIVQQVREDTTITFF